MAFWEAREVPVLHSMNCGIIRAHVITPMMRNSCNTLIWYGCKRSSFFALDISLTGLFHIWLTHKTRRGGGMRHMPLHTYKVDCTCIKFFASKHNRFCSNFVCKYFWINLIFSIVCEHPNLLSTPANLRNSCVFGIFVHSPSCQICLTQATNLPIVLPVSWPRFLESTR